MKKTSPASIHPRGAREPGVRIGHHHADSGAAGPELIVAHLDALTGDRRRYERPQHELMARVAAMPRRAGRRDSRI